MATDYSKTYLNAGYALVIENVRDVKEIHDAAVFKAFLTDFNDSFTSNWNKKEVYGRMDPIMTFQNTVRVITLSFDVPSYDHMEADLNWTQIDYLIRSLYPTYDGSSTLSASPLFRVKFANLIQNAVTGQGLLCAIEGFQAVPDLDQGFFTDEQGGVAANQSGGDARFLLPKTFNLSMTLNVLHEHSLGYGEHGQFRDAGENFPHRNVETIIQNEPASTATDIADADPDDPNPGMSSFLGAAAGKIHSA
jgi:hypothetical protein